MRITIIGGGIAGALLAWRLTTAAPAGDLRLCLGDTPGRADATAVSGGLVRGFETVAHLCQDAADSLRELYLDDRLRDWAGYTEIGSVYLLDDAAVDLAGLTRLVDQRMPGSLSVLSADEVRAAAPFRAVTEGSVAVVERRSGYISPARLRAAALAALASAGVAITTEPVPEIVAAGSDADVVVVAAGAWTPRLLAGAGHASTGDAVGGMRTKAIQYVRCPAQPLDLGMGLGTGAFVDDISGLYGRPCGPNRYLLGLSTDRWDVDPDVVPVDPEHTDRVLDVAAERIGLARTAGSTESVISVDCYHRPPGLALRTVGPGVYTFTGGSGGAAKTALAASRRAAEQLLARTS